MKITFRFFGPPLTNTHQSPTEVTLPLYGELTDDDLRYVLFVEQRINQLIQGRVHIEVVEE